MAKVLLHPRVYSFLHVPVQSGSNSVLADMKREYTREDFECLIDFLRERYETLVSCECCELVLVVASGRAQTGE